MHSQEKHVRTYGEIAHTPADMRNQLAGHERFQVNPDTPPGVGHALHQTKMATSYHLALCSEHSRAPERSSDSDTKVRWRRHPDNIKDSNGMDKKEREQGKKKDAPGKQLTAGNYKEEEKEGRK